MTVVAAQSSDSGTPRAPQLPLTCYASRRRALLSLFGCLVFVAIFYWFIIDPWANDPSPQKTRIVSLLGIVLFGLGAVAALYLLIWKTSILTLDEEGISIAGHRRWFAWVEIADFDFVYQQVSGRFGVGPREIVSIGVFLKDPGAYNALWGPTGRKLIERTERELGTAILIPCALLSIDPDTLIAWLSEYRAEYSR
jgi:hypothetical protein